jgi:hypothetical protein
MLEKIWLSCSEFQKSTLTLSVLILSTLIGMAIVDSDRFSVNGNGLEVTKTAIANQAQLEQALLLIKLRDQQIADLEKSAIAINQRTNVGGLLVEDFAKAEANFPSNVVGEIEETIERSRVVLDEELQ